MLCLHDYIFYLTKSNDYLFADTLECGLWRLTISEIAAIEEKQKLSKFDQVNTTIVSTGNKNAAVSILFSLLHQNKVTMSVCNLKGEKITTLFNGNLAAGEHCIKWITRNYTNGLYVLRIYTGSTYMSKVIPIY